MYDFVSTMGPLIYKRTKWETKLTVLSHARVYETPNVLKQCETLKFDHFWEKTPANRFKVFMEHVMKEMTTICKKMFDLKVVVLNFLFLQPNHRNSNTPHVCNHSNKVTYWTWRRLGWEAVS